MEGFNQDHSIESDKNVTFMRKYLLKSKTNSEEGIYYL
jgi:hypothetical protein